MTSLNDIIYQEPIVRLPDASLTAVDNIEVDDYLKFKKLEKQLEHLDVMEEYVKLDMRNLEKELLHAQEEVSFLWFIC
jgi:26S proteasome regulatory subunit T3